MANVKRDPTPLPFTQIAVLLWSQLSEPVAFSSIMPFINQELVEIGVSKSETEVGYASGWIESCFYICEMTTVMYWGKLSDRIGRKPVIAFGLFGCGLSIFLFGLSKTFWTLVISRGLSGLLNGNIAVVKSSIAERWALGPGIGSVLARHSVPSFFPFARFLADYPYFLACFVSALFPLTACVLVTLFFKETRASQPYKQYMPLGEAEPMLDAYDESAPQTPTFSKSLEKDDPETAISAERQWTTWDLIARKSCQVAILNYASLAFLDVVFFAIYVIWLYTPVKDGGLGYEPSSIGSVLAAQGVFSGVASYWGYPFLEKRMGNKAIFQIALASFALVVILMPVLNIMADRLGGALTWPVVLVLAIQIIISSTIIFAYAASFMFITNASPHNSALGRLNGLAQTTVSFSRAAGPSIATTLFAYSITHNVLGGNLAYVVILGLNLVALATSTLL